MVDKSPSSLKVLILGLALRASNKVWMLSLVESETDLWLPADKSADPDWKKDDNIPPIVKVQPHPKKNRL